MSFTIIASNTNFFVTCVGKSGGGGGGKAQTTIIDIPIPKVDTTELEVVHVFPQGMGGGYGGYGGYNSYPNGIPSFSVVTQENGTTQSSNVWGFNPGTMARKLNKGEQTKDSKALKPEQSTEDKPPVKSNAILQASAPVKSDVKSVPESAPELQKKIELDASVTKPVTQDLKKEEEVGLKQTKQVSEETTAKSDQSILKSTPSTAKPARDLKLIKSLDQHIESFEKNDDPWILV